MTIIKAFFGGRMVYRRVLRGYRSHEGLDIAISNAKNVDFKNYTCVIITI